VKDEFPYEALLCGEYEQLLNDCQRALEQWNGRSERIRQAHLQGEATGRELLRLQARFAKAYTVLQRHVDRCERCQLASRLSQNVAASAQTMSTSHHQAN
jgi:predicted secreted protein